MKTKKQLLTLIVVTALGASSQLACAQSGGQFELSWSTIDGGGGTSSAGQFSISGTAGQPDASTPLTGCQFSLTGGFWSFLSVAQMPGAPLLKIKLVGTNVVISWPLGATGFTLEETTSLTGKVWNSTPQPVVNIGSEHTVTVPASGSLKCFRLKK